MKKVISSLLLIIIFSLSSCMTVDQLMNKETAGVPDPDKQESTSSGSGNAAERFEYMKADLTKYIKLPAYTGLNVEIEYVEVSDEELDSAIKNIAKKYGAEEINDEIASDISDGECTSAENFREYYREVYRKTVYRTVAMNTLLAKISEKSEFKSGLPDVEVDYYYSDLRLQYEALALLRGIEYKNEDELYAAFDTTYEDVINQAKQYVKEDLVLYSIIQRENIMFTDKDYDRVLTENAEYNLAQSPDFLLSVGYDESNLENMKDYLDKNFSQLIITGCFEEEMKDFLLENNTVTELPEDDK